MYRVSSLGRPLDPRYKSNLHVVFASVGAALSMLLLNGFTAGSLGTSPIAAGMSVFVAWAIGRELDPDHDAVAALAMAISFVAVLFAPADLMLGAGVLIATRIVAGTVGASLRGLDMVVLVGIAALLGSGDLSIAAVPGLLVAAIVGASDRMQRLTLVTGILVASGSAALLVRSAVVWELGPAAGLVMLLLAVVAVGYPTPVGPIAAQADLGGRLSQRRVALARLLAAATVAVGFMISGGTGSGAVFPTAGAAAVAVTVVGATRVRFSTTQAVSKEPARSG